MARYAVGCGAACVLLPAHPSRSKQLAKLVGNGQLKKFLEEGAVGKWVGESKLKEVGASECRTFHKNCHNAHTCECHASGYRLRSWRSWALTWIT